MTQEAVKALDRQVGGNHYKSMPVEPIEVMRAALSPEEYRGYLKGSIIKYSMRAGHKEGTDDGAKARHYMQFLQEFTDGAE